ncbi:MAG: NUDIX hydrolase [Phycisphaerales bacterium]|nr:NUDIX hydrolase [Phycisphaerales bacterium]
MSEPRPRGRTVLRTRKFDVEELQTEAGVRHVIRHPGAVVLLPLRETAAGVRIVAIRNRRIAVGEALLELPAGTLEPPEPPASTAARELEEETGYGAATLELLGRFHTTPGMTDELMHAYIARGLRPVGQRLEAGEEIQVVELSPVELWRAVDRGDVRDAKTLACLLLALRKGMLPAAGPEVAR